MKNKFKILGFILIGISFLLITLGIVLGNIDIKDKNETTSRKEENQEENVGFVVKNIYTDYSLEQQIALILASDYIKDQATIDNLVEAKYDNNQFSFKYIIKKGEGDKNNTIEINTNDFVIYNLNTVIYDNDIPNSLNVNEYDDILYTTKNLVYDLAKKNNYTVGETFNHKKMMAILDILKESNIGEYIETVEDNGYKLITYSAIPKDKVSFVFKKDDGSYLNIYNVLFDISSWNIYGVDSKQISNKYEYYEFISGYLVDKTIDVDVDTNNKLREEIGTFLDG